MAIDMADSAAAPPAGGVEEIWPQDRRPLVGLVSAKNPVAALLDTVDSLFAGGASKVLVVDDGSDDPESLEVFDKAEEHGAEVVHLHRNMGKSNALRSGFYRLTEIYGGRPFIIIQVDDDTIGADMTIPAQMIEDGKADIVDIRVKTFHGTNLISDLQQVNYWITNVIIKRIQDALRARLWISGASVMYTSEAAQVLLVPHAVTQTEDTEGRFRAVGHGLRVRYCSSKKSEFLTMVPETWPAWVRQWKRWAIGNGQVIRLYGLGGGNARIALVNFLAWVVMLNAIFMPLMVVVLGTSFLPAPEPVAEAQEAVVSIPYVGWAVATLAWMLVYGFVIGTLAGLWLKRINLAWSGMFIIVSSVLWASLSVYGLLRAIKHPTAESLTWDPPKRMSAALETSV